MSQLIRPNNKLWTPERLIQPWSWFAERSVQMWGLTEGGGSLVHEVRGKSVGTVQGTPAWTPGIDGTKGLTFDGTNHWITGLTNMVANGEAFTVIAVYSSTDITNQPVAYSEGNSGNDIPVLWCGVGRINGGQPSFTIRDDANVLVDLNSVVSTSGGGVSSVAWRQNSKSSRDIWVNGIKAASDATTITALTLDVAGIGYTARITNSATNRFIGSMYLVATWNFALPDALLQEMNTDTFALVRYRNLVQRAAVSPHPPNVKQTAFKFRNDDGSETTATNYAAENINIVQNPTVNTRLRIQLDTL